MTEQLVYEMGDPRSYITPDGVADFTTIQLRPAGRNRVRVSGIRGAPRTAMLKVSIAYFWGYKAVGTLVYAWPEAFDKAKAADRSSASASPTWASPSIRSSPSSSASTRPMAG